MNTTTPNSSSTPAVIPVGNHRYLTRPPERPQTYWPHLRLIDLVNGSRDGRSTHPDTALEAAPTAPTSWARANTALRDERHHREDLTLQARTLTHTSRQATIIRDLEHATEEAARVREAIIEARSTLAGVPALTDDEATARRASEAGTDPLIIRHRRQREHHQRTIAPIQAQITNLAGQECTLQDSIKTLTSELHHIAGQLQALAAATQARKNIISEHHARRAAVYQRAYARAAHHRRSAYTAGPAAPTDATPTGPSRALVVTRTPRGRLDP